MIWVMLSFQSLQQDDTFNISVISFCEAKTPANLKDYGPAILFTVSIKKYFHTILDLHQKDNQSTSLFSFYNFCVPAQRVKLNTMKVSFALYLIFQSNMLRIILNKTCCSR